MIKNIEKDIFTFIKDFNNLKSKFSKRKNFIVNIIEISFNIKSKGKKIWQIM